MAYAGPVGLKWRLLRCEVEKPLIPEAGKVNFKWKSLYFCNQILQIFFDNGPI
jgi:hypothetical protein